MKRLKLGNFRHGQDVQFHHHTWGYIAGAAISVVGGAINNNKAKQNAGKVAPYQNVDLGQVQAGAVQGNIDNSSSIEQLVSRANSFNANQAVSLQNTTMPGYSDLAKSLSGRAQTLADHPYDVPKEVQDNIARIAAERGISAGTRGQFNDFSLLRDFGVNQLQYGASNLNQAQSLTGLLATIAPKVNPASPLAFYVTPAQAVSSVTNNNTQNQAIAQGAINAQNAATNAGNADTLAALSKIAGLYAGSKTSSGSPTVTGPGEITGSGGAPSGSIPGGSGAPITW